MECELSKLTSSSTFLHNPNCTTRYITEIATITVPGARCKTLDIVLILSWKGMLSEFVRLLTLLSGRSVLHFHHFGM